MRGREEGHLCFIPQSLLHLKVGTEGADKIFRILEHLGLEVFTGTLLDGEVEVDVILDRLHHLG